MAPNGCKIIHTKKKTIILSGEVILSAENSGKPLGSAPNPGGGTHSAPPDSLAGAEGVCCPPQEPHRALGLRPFNLAPMNNPGRALVYRSGSDLPISGTTPTDYVYVTAVRDVGTELICTLLYVGD